MAQDEAPQRASLFLTSFFLHLSYPSILTSICWVFFNSFLGLEIWEWWFSLNPSEMLDS